MSGEPSTKGGPPHNRKPRALSKRPAKSPAKNGILPAALAKRSSMICRSQPSRQSKAEPKSKATTAG
jgi:hypothetical protein